MYSPFQPTDKLKEAEDEKYDPFDPTGSPTSDVDERSVKMRDVKSNVEQGDKEKEKDPPDSTDTMTDLPSPCLVTQLPLRRRVDCSKRNRGERRSSSAESDNSEIEEGEIVGVAHRDGGNKISGDIAPHISPSISFFSTKPKRILRVLDGDGFVSVHTESNWDVDKELEDEPVVGVEDLRRKLVNRRKEKYLSFPASLPLSPEPQNLPSPLPASAPSSPRTPPVLQGSKNHKSSKCSKDLEHQKIKDKKAGEKEEKRKKRKKDKDGSQEKRKEKDRGYKDVKERRSRSSSKKMKKKHHNSPEATRSGNSSEKGGNTRNVSSLSEDRQRERGRERDRVRDGDRDRNRKRPQERDMDKEQNWNSSDRKYESRNSSIQKKESEKNKRKHSSSRERGSSKRSKRSKETREGDRDRQREKDRRRDGRPVVPPSIQDLNGSDLFAIKRTITVTTTTTTTTVPGSPRLTPSSPRHPAQDIVKPHKRKKKKWHLGGDLEDQRSCHSQSVSPPRYHSYESDRYSDKLETDVLSLDGEALDSDYPSLEDTPPAALPPAPPDPGPKTKTNHLKGGRHHPKKKSRVVKKTGQSESPTSSSSNRTKSKCLSSLTITSGSADISTGRPLTKRARKMGKDKDQYKASRKDLVHSGKSKKDNGGSQKGKLQSQVSVLVREGVSSTTGASVVSGKLGMDLLGSGGTSGSAGGSVVGGSIAVVFCRDNESRSPFLKPCSEPLSLGSRCKDLTSMGKRSSLAAPPSSLTSSAVLKSKKTKTSSITSTSSSASSPSSSLATKRRRRPAKKPREKGEAVGLIVGDGSQTKPMPESWGVAPLDIQSVVGNGSTSVSPHTSQAGPTPSSSSSSSSSSSTSTSVVPPSSSPPHTPPTSMSTLRDTRESSPDSQTVDSSCKTPDPPFQVEDCPTQTSPTLPATSPSNLSTSQGAVFNVSANAGKPLSPDDAPKSLASPPCSSSSSTVCGLTSLSLPPSSSDPSSTSSVSSSSVVKPPPPPPPASNALPWSLQTGVDCTTGGVLALTALLFKMEEANIANRAKAQEFIQATSQILSQANQSQPQQHAPPTSSSQIPALTSLPPPAGLSPAQFILHGSLPLVGCTTTPPSLLHSSIGSSCAQTPPPIMPVVITGSCGETGWDSETRDPDKYLKKLHTQERAVEEVKLAIKPYYQRKDINKDEYKDILRKAVHKICHSRTGEINPVRVSNLVKLYVQRYKYFRKHGRSMDEEERDDREQGALHSSA
ncbi:splicing factor, arginine/serine-rich 19 [Brachionichthys hirsutus]|uniref:splicing factor, arginine/serine-rich 19 n=1 Tax=Brachionichthys hirsutus TaxID=412623 RepID=UPI003604CA22